MHNVLQNLQRNQRVYSTICFSLFFGWLLSVPFKGQVLYILAKNAGVSGDIHNYIAVIAHFIGLVTAGFFIKKQVTAKVTAITSTVVCIAGSLILLLPFSILWYIAIAAMSFFAGLLLAGWGFYYKAYSDSGQRLKTAADVIIFSNVLMIFINVVSVNISAVLGLGISIAGLAGMLLMAFRLESEVHPEHNTVNDARCLKSREGTLDIVKPLTLLCVFIVIITINSGLMYQVVNPAFAHFELLASYYWAVPYIAVLILLRNLPVKINQAYILYIAMIMIALSFTLFMGLDRSVTSYLIINTLMMGAFGVCDLFWWSIAGAFFDYSDNPAQILGTVLSMNVLGVLLGGIIGNELILSAGTGFDMLVIALAVIFAVMIMLPVLNSQLAKLIKSHVFIVRFAGMTEVEQEKTVQNFKADTQLTERETEVVKLLLRGYTYKAISEELLISENTMKYHVKNIYQKLNVNNKMDLIKMFSEN